jgi:hypothetical protein
MRASSREINAKRATRLPSLPKYFLSLLIFATFAPVQISELRAELSQSSQFTSINVSTIEMDPYDLNVPTYLHDSVFPFADFPCDGATEDRPSSKSPAPTTLSPSIDGRYHLNGASLFDTECIDPALLETPNPTAMSDFINDYSFPAMQFTQNELSPYYPEWQSPATDFEQQQQNFQTQQGVFPNALDASGHDTSFDWPGAQQGGLATLDHIANQPTGSLAFSQREHLG